MAKQLPLRQLALGANGLIDYELIFSKRKTIGISVYPDTRVVVRASQHTPIARVEEVLRERAAWILKHRSRFAAQPRADVQPRRYVSGEMFRYLGKDYTLCVEQAAKERVILAPDNLIVQTPSPNDPRCVEALLDKWYTKQAKRVFAERLEVCFTVIKTWNVAYPKLALRRMKTRWGSCTSKGKVTLNIRLIQAPVVLIDYVICHELCHLREMNHSKAFYALMSAIRPGWKDEKRRLNAYDFMS